MKRCVLDFILFFVISSFLICHHVQGLELLYIEFKPQHTIIGYLQKSKSIIDEYALLERNPLQNISNDDSDPSIEIEIQSRFADAVQSGKKILFYAHSWLGDTEPYFSKSIKLLLNQVLPDKDWLVVVLIRPTSLLSYDQNYQSAYQWGCNAYSILIPLFAMIQSNQSNNYFLAHSMGSQFLEGILDAHHDSTIPFNQLILTVPDSDLEFMDKLSDCRLANRVTLYVHAEDRMLHTAELLQGKARLGSQCIESIHARCSTIQLVDTSKSCFVRERLDLSNHAYFNSAHGISKDIRYILSGYNLESNRVEVQHGKFKIIPKENP